MKERGIKNSIDDRMIANYSMLDNESYFERGICKDLKSTLNNIVLNITADFIKNIGGIIAQEYINERNTQN